LVEHVKQAGVVGAGGGGFPAHVKLAARAETVNAYGAECEPLLRKDAVVMEEQAAELVQGVQLTMATVGAKAGVIGIKAKKQAAVEAIKAAVATGADAANGCLIDQFVIPNLHPEVFAALGRTQPAQPEGALGILESFNISSMIEAADAAVKAAHVTVLELRLAMALGGKAFCTMTGEAASVQAAVAAGRQVISAAGMLVYATVISRPHPDAYRELV
jgi:microcompartment protein CcmL/EutN